MDRYLEKFILRHLTSFSDIPLSLPRPNRGHTWSISWKVNDGDLVLPDQVLLTAVSDSDNASETITAVLPGRIHILIPDGPFVPELRDVGILEYGLKFDAYLTRKEEEQDLEIRKDRANLQAAGEQYQKILDLHTPLKSDVETASEDNRKCEEIACRLSDDLRNFESMAPEDAAEPKLLLETFLHRVENIPSGDDPPSHTHIFNLYTLLMKRLPVPESTPSPYTLPEVKSVLLDFLYNRFNPIFEDTLSLFSEADLEVLSTGWDQVRQAHQNRFREKLGLPPLPETSSSPPVFSETRS